MTEVEKGYLGRIQRTNTDLAKFHKEKDFSSMSENEALYLGEKIELQGVIIAKLDAVISLREEDTQKQIEAVQGLIGFRESVKGNYSIETGSYLTQEIDLDDLTEHLRTLTETLKPFLGDDKLEV